MGDTSVANDRKEHSGQAIVLGATQTHSEKRDLRTPLLHLSLSIHFFAK